MDADPPWYSSKRRVKTRGPTTIVRARIAFVNRRITARAIEAEIVAAIAHNTGLFQFSPPPLFFSTPFRDRIGLDT